MIKKIVAFTLLGLSCLSAAEPVDQASFLNFVTTYCVDCHGPEKQKGDRRYDQLSLPIENEDTLIDLQDVMDQLNLSEMPPKKAKKHPNDQQRMDMIAWLNQSIETYLQKDKEEAAKVALRRLNQREYVNSVRDLFDMNVDMFNPVRSFPSDQLSHHMDNIGQKLVTSGFLLDKVIQAADEVVEKAMMPLTKPELKEWSFKGPFATQPEMRAAHKRTFNNKYIAIYEHIDSTPHEGAYGFIDAFKEGVHADGVYEIKVKAQALNRENPFKLWDLRMLDRSPFRLGIMPGSIEYGDLYHTQPDEKVMAEVTLKDGEPQWYTFKIPLDKGFTPRFTFSNGIYNLRNLHNRLVKEYPQEFGGGKPSGIVKDRVRVIQSEKLPQIRISEVQIKGPLYETWPPKTQRSVIGDQRYSLERTHDILKNFAERAYRRPVTEREMQMLMSIVDRQKHSGKMSYGAFKDGLKAILSSPNFLYHNAVDKKDPVAFNYGLASRLSYFLWSSVPDQRLLDLAKEGQLADPKVRVAEMKRMLKDPKAEAFIQGFLDSWLNLRALDEIQPDRKQFERFYSHRLNGAMREETYLYTQYILENNKSVLDFVFSDYSFVNLALAKHYWVHDTEGMDHRFQKYTFKHLPRGGLLGQGSVLKITANGIDTSPVMRGVWMLENILGTPPPLPPPDVEPLDPDTRGAKNIRDQLKKHREVATCFDCHQRIDPIGFAFENFDPIGEWRKNYPKRGGKIDASGEMPDGTQFNDVMGLRKALTKKTPFFVRHLTEKLMSYALGQHLEARDRYVIEKITAQAKEQGYGFQDLLALIVSSELFEGK